MSFVIISRSIRGPCALHDVLPMSMNGRYFSTTKLLDSSDEQAATRRDLVSMVADEKRGIFRVLDIGLPKRYGERKPRRSDRRPIKAIPREKTMKPDQDWMSVWPAQRTFHPASVPLPVRQGFAHLKGQVTPHKYANVELMKIPNFLHLTPPVIKRQCQLLKPFCTKWPEELDSSETLESHFPVVESTTDYLNASSSIRDNRSRIVTSRFSVAALFLDYPSRDKFIRLVGPNRYNVVDDTVTLSSDRCPYRKQNSDYIDYLIKALYFECRRREDWEMKADSDLEQFTWESARIVAKELLDKKDAEVLSEHHKSISQLLNEGENVNTLQGYKRATQKLFGIEDTLPVDAEAQN